MCLVLTVVSPRTFNVVRGRFACWALCLYPAGSTQPPTPSSARLSSPALETPRTVLPPRVIPQPTAYPSCKGSTSYVGDGLCDPENNNAECDFDGGDCCKNTCKNGTRFFCGASGYECKGPNAPLGAYSSAHTGWKWC